MGNDYSLALWFIGLGSCGTCVGTFEIDSDLEETTSALESLDERLGQLNRNLTRIDLDSPLRISVEPLGEPVAYDELSLEQGNPYLVIDGTTYRLVQEE